MLLYFIGSSSSAAESDSTESGTEVSDTVKGIDITKEDGVLTLTLNRPKKLNAITGEVCIFFLVIIWLLFSLDLWERLFGK